MRSRVFMTRQEFYAAREEGAESVWDTLASVVTRAAELSAEKGVRHRVRVWSTSSYQRNIGKPERLAYYLIEEVR